MHRNNLGAVRADRVRLAAFVLISIASIGESITDNSDGHANAFVFPVRSPNEVDSASVGVSSVDAIRNGLLPTPADGCGQFRPPIRVKTPLISRSDASFMPSVVQLGHEYGGLPNWECMGVLISDRHVLTAASCMERQPRFVRLGQIDRSQPTSPNYADRRIDAVVSHPQYERRQREHNIAVVRMDRPVEFSEHIAPACVPWTEPLRSKNYSSYNPFVVGWWTTQSDMGGFNRLLDRQHTVESSCDRQAGDEFRPTPGLLCTENWSHENGPCTEDGSPLLQPERVEPVRPDEVHEYRMFVTGIASFGFDCEFDDASRSPLGYTRVQDYVDWIRENVV